MSESKITGEGGQAVRDKRGRIGITAGPRYVRSERIPVTWLGESSTRIAHLDDLEPVELSVVGVGMECDNCEEEATSFYPDLVTPVQLCDSCEHDARRSGFEPGVS